MIETSLPTTSIARSVQGLTTTLVVLALALAGIAALFSLVLGQRLGSPLHTLTDAAARIGRGDLDTPVALAPGAEIGTLAATLEEMRGQLLRLTADLRREQAEAHAVVTGIVEGVFTVDRERRIRYLNPQAAALLGLDEQAAIGRFCGDVLRPQGSGGVRPCEEHCPIIHARFRGGARAAEHLLLGDGRRRTVVITSAPGGRGPPGAGAPRRDRDRGHPPAARHGARQHLARVQDAALGAAGLDRAAAGPAARSLDRADRRAGAGAPARHAAPDSADRQSAGERADRGEATTRCASGPSRSTR